MHLLAAGRMTEAGHRLLQSQQRGIKWSILLEAPFLTAQSSLETPSEKLMGDIHHRTLDLHLCVYAYHSYSAFRDVQRISQSRRGDMLDHRSGQDLLHRYEDRVLGIPILASGCGSHRHISAAVEKCHHARRRNPRMNWSTAWVVAVPVGLEVRSN